MGFKGVKLYKRVFMMANSKDPDQPAEIYSLISSFAIFDLLQLIADNECPDQTARIVTQADLGLRCPNMPEDTFSQGAAHMKCH